jgi:4-amino-4-deoxy-L-arabinose transferase-like glycosyltransferase
MKPPETPNPLRREWFVVAVLTLAAAMLRFSRLGRMGLTHFDEGIYALTGLWSVSPRGLAGLDPEVIPYAPPGFPILVGLAYGVLGVSDISALLVGLVCGVLTVPVASWVGRRTFGPGAGGAAAAFAALAVAHLAFSRKALTDAPFLLAWLAAMGLGSRFLERPGLVRAVALGLAVGLAQNVKYNGWVAGVVVIVAALTGIAVDPAQRRGSAVGRTFGWGLVAAMIAAGLYWPWFRFVETHGGYAALVRHHQGYMTGPSSWVVHWNQQLAQVVALSGGVVWCAVTWAVAWFSAAIAANGARLVADHSRWDWARFRIGLLFGAAVMAGLPNIGWWAGLAWFGWLLADPRPAARVLGAWWLVLSVLTPFYHPYARLWLPLHAAGWVLLAGAVVAVGRFSEQGESDSLTGRAVLKSPGVLARGLVLLACLIVARAHWRGEHPRPFPIATAFLPTDGLKTAVASLFGPSLLPADGSASLRVLARRPVAFYLALQGKVHVQLVADKAAIEAGPASRSDWALIDEAVVPGGVIPSALGNRTGLGYSSILSWRVRLDPVTLLDVHPEVAMSGDGQQRAGLVLLRPGAPVRRKSSDPRSDPRSGRPSP